MKVERDYGLRVITPRSFLLSDNTSKRGYTRSTPSRCAYVWEGRQNGNPVRVEVSHSYPVNTPCKFEWVGNQ